jgi:hypothetical protein
MPTVQARIPTTRAARYLAQFCDHAAAMSAGNRPGAAGHGGHGGPDVSVERAGTRAVVAFGTRGRCTFDAGPAALLATIEAADQEALARIRQIVTDDLTRFGRRAALTVTWTSGGSAAPGAT